MQSFADESTLQVCHSDVKEKLLSMLQIGNLEHKKISGVQKSGVRCRHAGNEKDFSIFMTESHSYSKATKLNDACKLT